MTRLALALCGFLLATSSLVAGYQFSSLRGLPDPGSVDARQSELASDDAAVTVDFIVTQCVPEQGPETTTSAGIDTPLTIEAGMIAPEVEISLPKKRPSVQPAVSPRPDNAPTLRASPPKGPASRVVKISPSVWSLE